MDAERLPSSARQLAYDATGGNIEVDKGYKTRFYIKDGDVQQVILVRILVSVYDSSTDLQPHVGSTCHQLGSRFSWILASGLLLLSLLYTNGSLAIMIQR